MTDTWLSLHVFYGGDQDSVIVNSISPTLRRFRADGRIARYFFIRYWNGGPHLRVRMQCLRPADQVEREFREAVQPFLDRAPADAIDDGSYAAECERIYSMERTLADLPADLEPLELIQPSRSIQARPYRFDGERYGGAWAEESTHDHAWASTEIACCVLDLTQDNPESRRVFALHAAAVVPRVLDTDDATALEYFTRWSEVDAGLSDTRDERRWEERGFLPYGMQRAAVDDVRGLIEGREPSAPEFWLLLLAAWRKELAHRRECLSQARRVHGLDVQPDYSILYAMHLFLNRLGMGLRIECYLYYLIARTLRDRVSASCNDRRGIVS